MKWLWKSFSELSTMELYQAVKLREQVFVVEQNCVYLDCDGKDPQAWHLLGYKDDQLVAYLRVFGLGLKFSESSLGRVVTSSVVRGSGAGKELIRVGVEKTLEQFPASGIRISAQAYLQKLFSWEIRCATNLITRSACQQIDLQGLVFPRWAPAHHPRAGATNSSAHPAPPPHFQFSLRSNRKRVRLFSSSPVGLDD